MKKVLLLSAALFMLGFQSMAQTFANAAQLKDTKANIYPMMKDQMYSTIINASGSKVEMMNTIKNYLIEYELADSTALSVVNFDEDLSEIKLPLCYKEGQSFARGMMNAAQVAPPIFLQFDAIFAFNNEGQMMLTLTNFSGAIMCFVDDNGVINGRKKSRCVEKDGKDYNEYDSKITGEYSTILLLNTGVGQFLLASNGNGWDYVTAAHKEFLNKRRDQFKMYEDAMKYGSTEFITEETIVNYQLAGFNGDKQKKMWQEIANNYNSGNWVLGMNYYRWSNDFQDYFNMVFRSFANLLNGSIESIALDGNIIYEEFEGKVLPVDPKERKQWIKKGYSL